MDAYLSSALRLGDGVVEGLLGGDAVEERRLDGLEDDVVDVGLLAGWSGRCPRRSR